MIDYIKSIFPATHKHPQRFPFEWHTAQAWDPMLADLQAHEHGIVRRVSAEAVRANGLVLDFEGDGFINVRVN